MRLKKQEDKGQKETLRKLMEQENEYARELKEQENHFKRKLKEHGDKVKNCHFGETCKNLASNTCDYHHPEGQLIDAGVKHQQAMRFMVHDDHKIALMLADEYEKLNKKDQLQMNAQGMDQKILVNEWECPICTFVNPNDDTKCDMCDAPRS